MSTPSGARHPEHRRAPRRRRRGEPPQPRGLRRDRRVLARLDDDRRCRRPGCHPETGPPPASRSSIEVTRGPAPPARASRPRPCRSPRRSRPPRRSTGRGPRLRRASGSNSAAARAPRVGAGVRRGRGRGRASRRRAGRRRAGHGRSGAPGGRFVAPVAQRRRGAPVHGLARVPGADPRTGHAHGVARPASASRARKTFSATGERQMLPEQTKTTRTPAMTPAAAAAERMSSCASRQRNAPFAADTERPHRSTTAAERRPRRRQDGESPRPRAPRHGRRAGGTRRIHDFQLDMGPCLPAPLSRRFRRAAQGRDARDRELSRRHHVHRRDPHSNRGRRHIRRSDGRFEPAQAGAAIRHAPLHRLDHLQGIPEHFEKGRALVRRFQKQST